MGASAVNNIEFDIFARNYSQEETPDKPFPVASYYVMLLIVMVLASLIL